MKLFKAFLAGALLLPLMGCSVYIQESGVLLENGHVYDHVWPRTYVLYRDGREYEVQCAHITKSTYGWVDCDGRLFRTYEIDNGCVKNCEQYHLKNVK